MNIEIFNIFNFYNLRIQYNLITVDMRKLILVVFTFILLAGVNVGKAQTALPYSINFGDSQEGWTAVDNSPTPGTTWGYNARWAYIGGNYYGSVMMMTDYASECNDYYVSPGFTLEAGKVYTIESNACMENFGMNGCSLSIGYASSASDMSTFVKLNDIIRSIPQPKKLRSRHLRAELSILHFTTRVRRSATHVSFLSSNCMRAMMRARLPKRLS